MKDETDNQKTPDKDETAEIINFPLPEDSRYLTFDLERANLRGRVIRLGSVLNQIIDPHAYPEKVAKLVAETVTLSVLLSSMLKYEGIFILQAQGEGPIHRLVSDVTSEGDARGTGGFDAEALEELLKTSIPM